jgi:pyruvate dehydrogenase E2 component (dihydrolipoamide acetyltransferase)
MAMELVKFRDRLKAISGDSRVPSFTDMLVKLVAARLPECELLNACWHKEGIWIYDEVNIAIAIDTDEGLVAPVIRNVPDRSLAEVAEQSLRLIEQARAGTLSQDRLQGGTFTVTNLGMYGIDFFTPILNLPQSAILGVGRIVLEPILQVGAVVSGATMCLSLTFDHRVIDGAPAARWLKGLAERIQEPTVLEQL